MFDNRIRFAVAAVIGFAFLLVTGCGSDSVPSRDSTQVPKPSVPERPTQVSEQARPDRSAPVISEADLEALKHAGLTDPVPQIVASLRAHPEIIPHAGVLGGTMGFYMEQEIYVLNAKTVFARFTDGHIEGSGFFEFKVQPDSSIVWRVLSSYTEEPPDVEKSQ